jgi:uncharacterized membrane protein (UPF0127 family)
MPQAAVLHTASGPCPLFLYIAAGFVSRLAGLTFKRSLASQEGLLITRCASVHTAFMRFVIDVVYLDGDGIVTLCVPHLSPWRTSLAGLRTRPRTRHTLELPAGSVRLWGIRAGDRLEAAMFPPVR